jgi:hypothetical protein
LRKLAFGIDHERTILADFYIILSASLCTIRTGIFHTYAHVTCFIGTANLFRLIPHAVFAYHNGFVIGVTFPRIGCAFRIFRNADMILTSGIKSFARLILGTRVVAHAVNTGLSHSTSRIA